LVYLDGTQIKRGNAHRLQNRPRVSR
jgi:hypothetical protein